MFCPFYMIDIIVPPWFKEAKNAFFSVVLSDSFTFEAIVRSYIESLDNVPPAVL
jgi:hypothetical protein